MRRLTLLTNPDKCNLHCPLCFLNQRDRPFGMGEMPFEVAKVAIDRYFENLREVIPSTMGEPLLYSKFADLLDYCSARKIPLNLTTNGTFPGNWRTPAGMERLLRACSDIKISCMAFDEEGFAEMMPGATFTQWRGNVERLLEVARLFQDDVVSERKVATVSLQVTLHRKLLPFATEILAWAESVGIARIKWNLPVFISAGESLRKEYGVDLATVRELREILKSERARCEGNLFFAGKRGLHDMPDSGQCDFFRDEIWILPDGTEERCPNPERRFGDGASAGATCEKCLLFNQDL